MTNAAAYRRTYFNSKSAYSKIALMEYYSGKYSPQQAANACGSADCGWARQATLYTNFASKKRLKNRAVAIRLQPFVGRLYELKPTPNT
jgi:hypothetical protein